MVMRKILTKYNSPSFTTVMTMKAEAFMFYKQCLRRFKKGAMFYPKGLGVNRCNYEWTVSALKWVLSSIDREVEPFSYSTICRIHFNLNFTSVPLWNVDLNQDNFFMYNYWQMRDPFFVYEVVSIREEYSEGRKHRYIKFKTLTEEVMFDSAIELKKHSPFPSWKSDENMLREQFRCPDWRLQLARGLSSLPRQTQAVGPNVSIVLPFKSSLRN